MKEDALLLVDDDVPFRQRLAKALTARGCPVLEAGSAADAEAIARGHALGGAVVDLKLPGGSGLEAIHRLRAVQPALRLIVLTGYSSVATALEALRAGASDYLAKPVDADTVLAALRGHPRGVAGEAAPAVPSLDRVEWEHIQRVLADCGGNISQTSRLLGIDRRSLQRKLAKYPPNR
jgi:two-component system response regulator RegA